MDYPKTVPGVGLVDGKFVDENATTGQVGSLIPSAWGNAVTDEMLAVLVAAGIAPVEGTNNQVAAAIATLITNALTKSNAVVGSMRNGKMVVAAASKNAVFTAEEVVVATALGGMAYRLGNYNQAIDLATVGAGGMDTGASPTSGYVGFYAGYNPTTGARTIFARNATSTVLGSVYGGANAPAGFTATGLVSVWPTNASGQLVPGAQIDRQVARVGASILSTTTSTTATGPVSLSIAGVVPPNAVSVRGQQLITFTSATGCAPSFSIAGDANYSAANLMYVSGSTGTGPNWGQNFNIPIASPQTLYYGIGNSAAISVTYAANVTGYTF